MRDDPASWMDSPQVKWTPEDHAKIGILRGRNWKMRSPGANGIGTEPFLVNDIANHPTMVAIVSAFLGARVEPVTHVREIYGVFPKHSDAAERLHHAR